MKPRVLLAMSGGIDSSIALLLLQKQGYEVIGATFRTWDYITESCYAKNTGCCSIDAIYEARNFAEKHGVEHHIFDFREEFKKVVIQNFVDEYKAGRTPNPCVLCNFKIKWGKMLESADKLNCSFIATGHYAGIKQRNNRYVLMNAEDEGKDQTYFLWMLTSEQLQRTLFPLSELTKEQIRKIASEHGFINLAEKRESQEICFIPNNNYREFIKEEFPEVAQQNKPGNVYDSSGKIIGKHKGYLNYTVGQRKGLGIALGEPVYVTAIDSQNNGVTVGKYSELQQQRLNVRDYVFNGFEEIPPTFDAEVKIRYNTKKVKARVNNNGSILSVHFEDPVFAVTQGQSAVFYNDNELIGGGIIC